MDRLPLTRDLVLIGGGHTHALVLRKWGMDPLAGVRVTLVNPGPTAPYSGMLPGFVAGHYSRDALDIDLVRLSRFAGARLIDGMVTAIDPVAKTVTVAGRPPVAYDVVSVDIGITSAMPQIAGFDKYAFAAKPLGPFASRWDSFRATADAPHVAIIGGGVAGVELAMAMAHALREKSPTVTVIDRSRVLAGLGYVARQKLLAALERMQVQVLEQAEVSEIFAEGVVLRDGRRIRSDFTTGAAGAFPQGWLAAIGVDTHDGFLCVNPQLQTSDPAIFAAGDCAHMGFDPRPKAGVFAVRQAPVLVHNLRAALAGGRMRTYRPQRDYLKLISLGGKSALAERIGTAREGRLLWAWKDWIDRRFMRRFDDLPAMAAPALPARAAYGVAAALGDKPMCGGCGAKVGRGALQQVLGAQFGDDAAEIAKGQFISTDHLRALTPDPLTMTRIAAVHALGDIWAMAASPQAATLSVILPRMSRELQERTLAEITAAATAVLDAAGARLAGGHTSLGDELTIGFTVTGVTKRPVTLRGAQAGDALILTKPLGSGTIMAADMAGKARGADVLACLAQMVQPQADAARILAGAHAMTDVTGFGLAGHLRGICDASGVGAVLDLDRLPLMDGAAALSQAGIRSTLFADNVAGAGPVGGPACDLLFDPQTAGGLLAVVDGVQAEDLLAALHKAGYPAARIGTVTEGSALETRQGPPR